MTDDAFVSLQIDRFERAWQAGSIPDITAFLPNEASLAKPIDVSALELLTELIKVDMEYRWRRLRSPQSGDGAHPCALATGAMPANPLTEDYLVRFPMLAASGSRVVQLLIEECRVRKKWGDDPDRSEYLQRFPAHAGELTGAIHSIEHELYQAVAKVYHAKRLVFEIGITREIEFGRQQLNDHQPYSHSRCNSKLRVVIAEALDRTISRRLLHVTICDGGAIVANLGRSISIKLDSAELIRPCESRQVDLPVLLSFRDIAIRVEPAMDLD